jgi:hypothetical protein
MTLVIVVLITVVVVGYLASVMLESKTAGSSLDQERAYGIAMIGVHQAMSRVRDALGPWDDPFKNFATDAPNFYWSLSPGRITRWSYAGAKPQINFALFSESDGTSVVNLNRPLADGSRPIIGGPNPPDLSVKWANVLSDPSKPAGQQRDYRPLRLLGGQRREVNVNTADGTEKYRQFARNRLTQRSEPGGLVCRKQRKGPLEIVGVARINGFSSPRNSPVSEGARRRPHRQRVCAHRHSRSPELVFLASQEWPLRSRRPEHSINMVISGITLRPVREIIPPRPNCRSISCQSG